jgi:hypothetical protein
VQLCTVIRSGREVAWLPGNHIVARNTQAPNAVMQSIESRGFKLAEAVWDDAAPESKRALEAATEMRHETIGEQMTAAKRPRVGGEIVNIEPDGCVIGAHDGTSAHTDDHVNGYPVANKSCKYANVGGATEPSGAQYYPNANLFVTALLRELVHTFIMKRRGRAVDPQSAT